MLPLSFLICFITSHIHAVLSQNCSAIDSYIQVLSSSNLSETITSSQALFAPYTYYIPFTKLAILNNPSDNPCDINGIKTDISNKIILLFESIGNCSIHHKVFVAEQNNATGVILANNDPTGIVETIIDDSAGNIETNIPLRSIPKPDGEMLVNEIISGEFVEIEFGCFDTIYPSIICILDTLGDKWYLDGEYQRQANIKYNDHPIWKKEGYYWVLNDIYIYLDSADGQSDWFWTITFDEYFISNHSIRAICTVSGISEPSLCPKWNSTKLVDNSTDIIFTYYSQLNVSNGLCVISDSYICIQSNQSTLVQIDGTYKQFNDLTPFWFRELDNCDTRPGYLQFKEGYFILNDAYNGWIIAICEVENNNTLIINDTTETWDSIKLSPDLCDDWYTIASNSLEENNLLFDDTFSIEMNTKCIDETCKEESLLPDKLCMTKNGIIHGFLEGEYIKTNTTGLNYGTIEYERNEILYDNDGDRINIYMWWYGEIDIDTHFKWWVISPYNLSYATAKQGANISIYGYCEAMVNNPINCNAGWSFYFATAFHSDSTFEILEGECIAETTLEPRIWPEYICIDLYNISLGSDSSYLPMEYFIGGYMNMYNKNNSQYPYYIKPYNNYWPYSIYLYFDSFYGYWFLGSRVYNDDWSVAICMQENGYTPIHCNEWYDYNLIQMNNMYFFECNESYIMTASPTVNPTQLPTINPTTNPTIEPTFIYTSEIIQTNDSNEKSIKKDKSNTKNIIILIVIIVLVILCFVVTFLYFKNKKKGNNNNDLKVSNMNNSIGKGFPQTDDGVAMVNQQPISTADAMDMTPLNVEGNEKEINENNTWKPIRNSDDDDNENEDGVHETEDFIK